MNAIRCSINAFAMTVCALILFDLPAPLLSFELPTNTLTLSRSGKISTSRSPLSQYPRLSTSMIPHWRRTSENVRSLVDGELRLLRKRSGNEDEISSDSFATEKYSAPKDQDTEDDRASSYGDNEKEEKVGTNDNGAERKKERGFSFRFPFFFSREDDDDSKDASETEDDEKQGRTVNSSTIYPDNEDASTTTSLDPAQTPTLDPVAYAKELKRQALKVRLEAEKMDAILTLEKISSLERQLEKESVKDKDSEVMQDIQNQIAILTKKLNVENIDATTNNSNSDSGTSDTSTKNKDETSEGDGTSLTITAAQPIEDKESIGAPDLSSEELADRTAEFLKAPTFLRQLTAKAAGFQDDSNVTAVVEKLFLDENSFMQSQENKKGDSMTDIADNISEEDLKLLISWFDDLPNFMKKVFSSLTQQDDVGKKMNATAIMLDLKGTLDDDVYRRFVQNIDTNVENDYDEDLPDDVMMTGLFPESTRKEDEAPTEAVMDRFYSQILLDNKDIFVPSEKPEPTLGGFFVRGDNRQKDGDELIAALDVAQEKLTGSSSELSFYYVKDPTPITEEQIFEMKRPPVLYITGPDIFKKRNPIVSFLVNALGYAGINFFSVYPLMLNEDIAAKVDEQITLASAASSGGDLDFLSELTTPIVFIYIAIQLAHEAAHFCFAKLYGFEMAIPGVFVPSPFLGITSTITALRSSPRNKQALFDFALAGPLLGIVLSLLAVFVGLQITLTLDTAGYNALPVLPVAFLQQSALGAGLVEAILGSDTLRGLAATATIHVHPYVIAGYASLIVNALNLTPIGRTDGGRVSLALFGRSGAQVVGFITAFSLLFGGIFNSDAMLLYFAFVIFFQFELEVPLRNEADDIDFGRAVLAITSTVLVLLTIIPMDK